MNKLKRSKILYLQQNVETKKIWKLKTRSMWSQRYSFKKKDKNLLNKSPQNLSKFYIKEDFQMINKYIKSSQHHWSSGKSNLQEWWCLTTYSLEVKMNKMTIGSISKDWGSWKFRTLLLECKLLQPVRKLFGIIY